MPASFTNIAGFIAFFFAVVISGCSRDNPINFTEEFVATEKLNCEGLIPDNLVFLKGIEISDSIISPKFDVNNFSYLAQVDHLVDTIRITLDQVNEDDDDNDSNIIQSIEVSVNGNAVLLDESSDVITLNMGDNQVVVTVDAVVKTVAPNEACIVKDEDGEIIANSANIKLDFNLMINRDFPADVDINFLEPNVVAIDSGDEFGRSVSVDGDTLAVGVFMEDGNAAGVHSSDTVLNEDDTALDSGAVYIYEKNNNGNWDFTFFIKASNAEAGDLFGTSVSLSDDFLAVSAPGEDSLSSGVGGREDDNQALDSGAVYIFKRGTSGWEQLHYIKPPQNSPGVDGFNDAFGNQVLIQDDVMLISAPREDSQLNEVTQPDSGTVHVYRYHSNIGSWEFEASLKADVARAGDSFGRSISLSNGFIVVGAPGEDSGLTGVISETVNVGNLEFGDPRFDESKPDSGAVYAFNLLGDVWEQSAFIKASNGDEGDLFGSALASSSEHLFIGASHEDGNGTLFNRNRNDNSLQDSGAAYRYDLQNGNWVETGYIKSSKVLAGAEFGSSLAFDNNDLLIGAPLHAVAETNSLGLVHVYNFVDLEEGSVDDPKISEDLTIVGSLLGKSLTQNQSGSLASDHFGGDISISGSTFVIGAKGHANQETGVTLENSGGVYVYH